MKLNPDCIRDILIAIESMYYNSTLSLSKLSTDLPQYTPEELNYHCIHLLDAGLINADSVCIPKSVLPQIGRIYDLTFSGHQFLANIRSDNVWNGVKAVGSKIGACSLEAFTQIASNVISELIKSHYGLR